jgi:hypothetical protein
LASGREMALSYFRRFTYCSTTLDVEVSEGHEVFIDKLRAGEKRHVIGELWFWRRGVR